MFIRNIRVACLANDERDERRGDEKNADDDGRVEQRFLKSAAGVESRGKVVSERASEPRGRALEQYGGDKQNREPDLDIGQKGNESLHYVPV